MSAGGSGGVASGGRLRLRGRIALPDYPVDVAWSADGRVLIIGCADGALLLVGVDPLEQLNRLEGHADGVLAVAWQKAGHLFASSGQDGAVLLWDAHSLQARRIHQDAQWSEQLAFADNGRLLAAATGRVLHVFDEHGQLRHRFADHAGAIAAVAWRPKAPEIAAAGNGGVRIHRLEPQLQTRDYPVRGACLSAAFNPDGRVLAAGMQEGSVHLWYVAAGTQSQMAGYGSRVSATEWSGNGRYLATAAGATLAVWDFSGKGAEGSHPLTYQAHSERISAIRFRPSGPWLVSAALDRRLLLWRVGAGDVPQDAHLLADECSVLRFSRDGARLAVGDARGGLAVFECEP